MTLPVVSLPTSRPIRRRFAIVIIALAGVLCAMALITGCSNSAGPDESDDTGYPLRTSPTRVAEKLLEAYEALDAEAFKDCLSDTFTFHLNPGWPPQPESWGIETEAAIAESMLGPDTDVLSISLYMTQLRAAPRTLSPETSSGDSVLVYVYDLWVYLPDDWIYWGTGTSHFRFVTDPDTTGPEGETLWEISRWDDTEDQSNRSESWTWSKIKNQYR